jgi:hypothetical protein
MILGLALEKRLRLMTPDTYMATYRMHASTYQYFMVTIHLNMKGQLD